MAKDVAFPYTSARFPPTPSWRMTMANVVTRDVLAEKLAKRAEITMSAARDEVRWFFDTISTALEKGDEVRIHGFGSFRTAQRAARMGRNPRTGEAVSVPARRVVRFAASTTLSGALKNARGAKRAGR
ncbi:MAG TPA: HU family DNA-binding protein [Candidatus Deferrimicrobium sp.]|nr:HU family DNA-binding protein [Candidatus Deferrimicrobium sp.]